MSNGEQRANPAPKKYVSLREVGRQLNIPPSTVVYYKDRFARYIPSEGGQGRRSRYPVRVLAIFRRIRELFEHNWSAQQIEAELAARFSRFFEQGRVEGGPDEAPLPGEAPGVHGAVRTLSTVLDKMSDVLESQAQFRGEIRSLRGEVEALQRERDELARRHAGTVAALEREVAGLRRAKAELEQSLRRLGEAVSSPDEDFLARPLVIRSAQGEYLGVSGRGKPFSLRDFIGLIERNAASARGISMHWSRTAGQWSLAVTARDAATGQERRIELLARRTVTPSRNVVTEIVRLNINGEDAPDALLLSLFRQVRDGFSG
jgi:hypothetical protein